MYAIRSYYELTAEDQKELETILSIVINQIPSYTNMVNASIGSWDVNADDSYNFV